MTTYEEDVESRKPFDRLSALLGVDAPPEMMIDMAADEIERLRAEVRQLEIDCRSMNTSLMGY